MPAKKAEPTTPALTHTERIAKFKAAYFMPGTEVHVDFAMLAAPGASPNPDKTVACQLGELGAGGCWVHLSGKKHFVNYVRIAEFWEEK